MGRFLRVMNTFEQNDKETSNFESNEPIIKLTDRIITLVKLKFLNFNHRRNRYDR